MSISLYFFSLFLRLRKRRHDEGTTKACIPVLQRLERIGIFFVYLQSQIIVLSMVESVPKSASIRRSWLPINSGYRTVSDITTSYDEAFILSLANAFDTDLSYYKVLRVEQFCRSLMQREQQLRRNPCKIRITKVASLIQRRANERRIFGL